MDIYFTDTIVKVTVSRDAFGKITETDSAELPARVTDNNRLIVDVNGKEVLGEMMIECNKKYTFSYQDKIKVKKKWGVVYSMPDKKFLIKKIVPDGGFKQEYIGLYI